MGKIDVQIDVQRKRRDSFRISDKMKPASSVKSSQLPNGDNESPANPTQKGSGSSSQRNPSSLNQNREAKSMNTDIYRAVTTGDIDGFKLATLDREGISLMDHVTPQGNTVLHLAAISGYNQLVELILTQCRNLLFKKNFMGNLAHHVAANAGHLFTIICLVHNAPLNLDLLGTGNKDGDTPLHMAMKNGHKEVAMFLIELNPKIACYPNRESKSPLYMAAKSGCVGLVKVMIEKRRGAIVTSYPAFWPRVKSVVHAAIAGNNIDIVDAILCNNSSLIYLEDEEGRRPLSYASFMGYLEGVQYFLGKYTHTAYRADRNGFFPIHVASAKSRITIIEKFLKHCPDSIELLNAEGQNILHVAAMRGKYNVVSYLLKLHMFEKYINERDVHGNTPLHLATMHWHPKVVSALTWDDRVNLELVNTEGFTALDAAEEYMGTNSSFRKRLTWKCLQSAGAPRAQHSSITKVNGRNIMPNETPGTEKYKDRVNTLLLVSTLVATVTFAAGFKMPGGYNSSDPHQGMATLVMKRTFHTFLICDTIAMYSSIIVAVALIWAQLGDLNLILTALKLAMPLLGIALTTMSIAFMAGVYLVVNSLTWLANLLLIMDSIFLATFLALFIPLFLPSSSSNPIIRYIVYYPFYLLMVATGSITDDDYDD